MDGETFVIASYSVESGPEGAELTEAERAVAEGAALGKSNAEIARRRGTSVRTVANLLARAFGKLGVRSRLELAARWARS
jgi:DNA-binding CsgD family transcriptional regulator